MSRSLAAVLILAVVAFLAPISFTLYQHRDTLIEMGKIDAGRGELLFFTSPS